VSTTFVSQNIWLQLTKAVRGSWSPSSVAVAYFGAGAGHLLPLIPGSRFVVDASDRTGASGQQVIDLGRFPEPESAKPG